MDSSTNTSAEDAGGPAASPVAYLGPPRHPDELGTLGKYRVLKQLGAGGMGAVFLGIDEALDRKVALKVMLPQHAAKAKAKERFLREARAAAKVKSDHVITLHEVGEANGVPFIAMEYLQGQPLDEFLTENSNPTAAQILRIGREVAAGLADAHALGLVHRDIKPANLWLEAPKGRVKILDFGLARSQTEDVQLTNSGAILGTPAYMSPEQAMGKPLDGRSDLFSLGGVLYRLCTGRLPFPGQSPMEVLTRLATEEPMPVRGLNPAIPEALATVVHTLLAKDPADRYATADEAGRAIAAVTLPGDGATQTLLLAPSTTKKTPWTLIGGLASIVVVLVAAAVLFNKFRDKGVDPKPPGPEVVEKKGPAAPPKNDPVFFNGTDLAGWQQAGPGHWRAENGEIIGANPDRESHWLGYRLPVRDFDISFEAKCIFNGGPGKSTFRFRRDRVTDQVTCIWLGTPAGVAYNLLPDQKGAALKYVTLTEHTEAVQHVFKEGDYNAFAVRLVGRRLTVKVNGVTACDQGLDISEGDQLMWTLTNECTDMRIRNIVFNDLSVPPPVATAERKGAEALLPHANLTLMLATGAVVTVNKGGQLPASAFTVTKIAFPAGAEEAPFVADVLLPALAGLGGLEELTDTLMRIETTGGELAILADMPAAKTLTKLFLQFQLNDGTLAALRKFPSLTNMHCFALRATDQMVSTLAADHPTLSDLGLIKLNRKAVTRTSLDAIAKMPLMSLDLTAIEFLDPADAKILGGLKDLRFISLQYSQGVTDEVVRQFAAAPFLSEVPLGATPISDASLTALTESKRLTYLNVQQTRVTAAGVATFKAARPGVNVEWDDTAEKK